MMESTRETATEMTNIYALNPEISPWGIYPLAMFRGFKEATQAEFAEFTVPGKPHQAPEVPSSSS